MMCVMHWMEIWVGSSIILWILFIEILRVKRLWVVLLWMEPLVSSVMIIGGKTNQPCWASEVRSMSHVSIFLLVATWGNQLLH